MRKRGVAVIVVLALLLAGCAGFQAVKGFICNPTPAQQAEAAKWLTIMDTLQGVAATIYPPAGIAKASAVMLVIKDGGCFLAAEVQAALDMIQNAQVASAKSKGMKKALVPINQQFPALFVATQ